MHKTVIVGLIQSKVVISNTENYKNVEIIIQDAVKQGAQILCLPERWYMIDPLIKPFEQTLQPKRGEYYQKVKNWAKKYNVPIISGAIWELDPTFPNPVITSYYFDKNGLERFEQQKIHLYGLEKLKFSPGNKVISYHEPDLDISLAILICFDLNISSDLTRMVMEQGCELIFSPTAIREKGLENWRIYVQSRALENMDRSFQGQSKIIQFKRGESTPVRLLTEEASDQPEAFVREIDLQFPNRIRKDRDEDRVDSSQITALRL
jgi:predicted amidohydrolase